MTNNPSNPTEQKRGRGRPKKNIEEGGRTLQTINVMDVIQPSDYDLRDELSMMESFTHSQSND